MREKLKTLKIADLRKIAADQGVANVSKLKKDELIEAIIVATDGGVRSNKPAEKKPEDPKKETALEDGAAKKRTTKKISDKKATSGKKSDDKKSDDKKSDDKKPDDKKAASKANDKAENKSGANKAADKKANAADSSENVKAEDAKQENKPEVKGDAKPEAKPEKVKYYEGLSEDDPYRQDYDPEMVDGERDSSGILEVMPDGFGFIRCENYLPGEHDIYVSPAQIKRFNLKTGDFIRGARRKKTQGEKFAALLFLKSVNGYHPSEIPKRKNFESLTPIFPNQRIHLELATSSTAMRIVDLISPIGKGQRGLIVSQPKAGKTTLLKQIAKSITTNYKDMHLLILLIDERPEEVTDMKESITGNNVEVIYSTFDELPEHHKRVSEMVIERARRLVEHGKDVCILLDSITRLTRAYNIVIAPSGRTLSGGLDPAALNMPKKFFGAARNMREGGSLTILATALVETGSKMDDVVYEEFKGTGNMELVLDRKLSERRIFPAIDVVKSGTRRDDLLLDPLEIETTTYIRRQLSGARSEDFVEDLIDTFSRTKSNYELCRRILRK